MGLIKTIISGLFTKMKRPLKNIDVENRALKLISKEKPAMAPKYKADKEALDNILKENPNLIEELSTKNIALDDRLKDVYVSSTDIKPIEPIVLSSDRPLPVKRTLVTQHEYGAKEPEVIQEGRVTLRTAIKFINDHHNEPLRYTSSIIAAEHKLDEDITSDILKYYKSFEFYIPKRLQEPEKNTNWAKKLIAAK